MPLSIGEAFDGYRIVGLLRSGGMGEVHRAAHPRLPRRDVPKILPTDFSHPVGYWTRGYSAATKAPAERNPVMVTTHVEAAQYLKDAGALEACRFRIGWARGRGDVRARIRGIRRGGSHLRCGR